MKHVKKSILLWYGSREMFELVAAVREYPAFMPWCERADVLDESPQGMTARLHLAYHGVRHAFTTRNTYSVGPAPGEHRVAMALVDGPFSALEGLWQFMPVGTPAADEALGTVGPDARACRIGFHLSYSFASTALETVVSPVFDRIANTFVDAFVARAERVYGAR
jgi:ribosome-associated toxin RatA of RatAB toxin-antitoxin module